VPHPFPTSAHSGVVIRQLRKSRDLSIEDLADAAGIDVSYLSGIERKKRNPSWEMIRSLAEALEIEASELVRRAETVASSEQRPGSAEKPQRP